MNLPIIQASELLKLYHAKDVIIIDVSNGKDAKLNYAAKRPLYSALSSERGQLLPTLANALSRYLHEQKREKRQVA